MTAEASLTVLVPTYRRPEDLTTCLRALAAQRLAPAEVLVVGRPDDDATWAVVERFGTELPLRAVTVHEPGHVQALNAGLREVATPLVSITDDDARPAPDWTERIVAHFRDPGVGAVGGRDVVWWEGEVVGGSARTVGRVRWFGRVVGNHHLDAPAQEVQFIKGANMSYRREALAPFDVNLAGRGAQSGNDMQASLRVHRAGWRIVWDPAVRVDHYPAVRFDDDGRLVQSPRARADINLNGVYVLLGLLPWWQKPAMLLYALLVGHREEPGPLLAPLVLWRTRDAAAVRLGMQVGLRGRLEGIRLFLRVRSGR